MLGASFAGALTGWDALSDYSVGYVLYQLLRSIVIWSWMLFVLYFGLRVLNLSNKIIDYANEAILPFYVLHHPVLVVTAFVTFTWGLALGIKYLVVSTLALLTTLALYDLCIRRINIMRWLFGMKLLHASRQELSPGSEPISSASRPGVSAIRQSERKEYTMQLCPPKKIFVKTPSDYGLSYQDIRFPSREDQLLLAGWFIPGVFPDGQLTTARAIIVVHGLDSSREAPEAGLLDLSVELVKQGFAVLAFDTRGHGESAPARPSMGYFEQNDVLGAVDFLRSGPLPFSALGRPRAIGGYGISMGGAALLLATAREPAIRAAVTDCAFAAFVPLIAQATKLPHVLMPAIANVIALFFGINYHAIRPIDVVASIAPRPLFFIHASTDTIVPPGNNHESQPADHYARKETLLKKKVPHRVHQEADQQDQTHHHRADDDHHDQWKQAPPDNGPNAAALRP